MKSLNCNPVIKTQTPLYPSKLAVLANPILLRENLPGTWVKRPEVRAAAFLLLGTGLPGCNESEKNRSNRADDCKAVIAPVFEYGTGQSRGRGMLGCVAVTGPVYLPEDEAWLIIHDELAEHGIDINRQYNAMDDILIPMAVSRKGYDWIDGRMGFRFIPEQTPLKPDGFDPEHGIHVEFVSGTYYRRYDPNNPNYRTVVSGVEISQHLGKQISSNFSKPEKSYWGIFYDPVTYSLHSSSLEKINVDEPFGNQDKTIKEELEKQLARIPESDTFTRKRMILLLKAKERSMGQLRKQVRDFAEWLKAQGAI